MTPATSQTDLHELLIRSEADGKHSTEADDLPRSGFDVALTNARIMVVDDEPLMIEVVRAHLQSAGYRNLLSTDSAASVLWNVISDRPDVLLLDLHMPHLSGLNILREIRRDPRLAHTPVIVLTASTDPDERLQALHLGATDFLQKPVQGAELRARLRNILMAKAYQDQLRDQSESLEQAVRQRTAEVEASRREVIHCLARAAEFRDDDTGRHVLRVGRYARIVGAELGLEDATLEMLEQAAQLHDIGKIGIADEILLKPGKLTPEEFDRMQRHCNLGQGIVQPMNKAETLASHRHPELGARILEAGRSHVLRLAQRIALTHHERWDGTGYPLGLAGEDIPLEGRITAVADVFDALSTKRPYKPAFPIDKCLAIMEEGRGTQFDPRVLDAFMHCREQIVQAQIECAECE